MSTPLVPTRECDYLEQDAPIRGQNFVCVSFVSPEDTLKRKDLFCFSRFLKSFSRDMSGFLDHLAAKYPDDADLLLTGMKERYKYIFDEDAVQDEYKFFANENAAEIDRAFKAENGFSTSVRGFKIRGTYDSFPEAESRATQIKKTDPVHDIYVAQVGCWCPWSPNPDDVQNQEYSETQLNTLMKSYRENQAKKDAHYAERKQTMVDKATEDARAAHERQQQQQSIDAMELLKFDETTTTVIPPDETTTIVEEVIE